VARVINCSIEQMTEVLRQSGIDRLSAVSLKDVSFAMLCLPAASGPQALTALANITDAAGRATASVWRPEQIKCLHDDINQTGFRIPMGLFSELLGLAKRTLVPESVEQMIVTPQ